MLARLRPAVAADPEPRAICRSTTKSPLMGICQGRECPESRRLSPKAAANSSITRSSTTCRCSRSLVARYRVAKLSALLQLGLPSMFGDAMPVNSPVQRVRPWTVQKPANRLLPVAEGDGDPKSPKVCQPSESLVVLTVQSMHRAGEHRCC
jgi:hypothetical protein